MTRKWALFLMLLAIVQTATHAAEADWTRLETQISGHRFNMFVPGRAKIDPYFSLEDPMLYESNAGSLLLDLYWSYDGFRKHFGGVRVTLTVEQFPLPAIGATEDYARARGRMCTKLVKKDSPPQEVNIMCGSHINPTQTIRSIL